MTTPEIIQIHHQQNQKTDQQEMSHKKRKISAVGDGYSSLLHGISLKCFIATGQELSHSRGRDWWSHKPSHWVHPKNVEKTGQWANSVLKLSFSNRKKSLKYFFLRLLVCFLKQCCRLPSSPALLSCSTAIAQWCSRSPWGEQDPASSPLCLPKTALQDVQEKLWGWKGWDHQLIKPPSVSHG